MANSGFQAAGWSSGTCGFTAAHNVFVRPEKVTRLDGKPMDAYDLATQQGKTTCEICGQWVICTDWPTAPWRHVTPEESMQFGPQEGT